MISTISKICAPFVLIFIIDLGYKAGILDNSIIEMKASFFKPNIWLNMCIEYIILCV